MEVILTCCAGIVLASGIYSILKDSLVQIAIGIMLIGYGANLMVFLSGGLAPWSPAFIPNNSSNPVQGSADPIPQALVLTAIVIGFGITAFILVLFHRANTIVGSHDTKDYLSGDEEIS